MALDWTRRIVGRRDFVKNAAAASLGAGIFSPLAATASIDLRPTRIANYRTLGRTGLRISDISFGASRLRLGDEDIVRHAFDCGVNYFDSAESYTGGDSEIVLGKALVGRRDKVFLTSKMITTPDSKRESIMAALEGSLRRLGTDHVDVYFQHACNDVERLKNPEWHEFADRAKQQGKIRFTGVSGHAGRLHESLDYAIDSGKFDVILCAYNFGQDPRFYQRFLRSFDFVALQPELPRILAKAHDKGVGVIAMKTLMGGRINDMRPYQKNGATFPQAAFRWVLSNPNVNALIVTMTSAAMVDEYVGASGATALLEDDPDLLKRYAVANSDSYCRIGCGICESSCPAGVPIGEVLRSRMYALDYKDRDLAVREYTLLSVNASACLECSSRACADACPYGLETACLTENTHRMLA